jgi:hypothetical protein
MFTAPAGIAAALHGTVVGGAELVDDDDVDDDADRTAADDEAEATVGLESLLHAASGMSTSTVAART